MSPLQALLDGMSAAEQRKRAGSQLTLGAFIEQLSQLHSDRKITGLGKPSSYRGYYEDLAFRPSVEIETVAAVLARARECMGKVFQGYKGGDYVMGALTPLWVAEYGDSGVRLMGLDVEAEPIRPIVKEED